MLKEPSIVYVGTKPLMNYVLAVITNFNAANADKVVLKARGRSISTAVDVAEVSRRRYLKNVRVDKIMIGSEELTMREQNRTRTVSTIEITLTHGSSSKKQKSVKREDPGNKAAKKSGSESDANGNSET
jgi:DNA-binding protein